MERDADAPHGAECAKIEDAGCTDVRLLRPLLLVVLPIALLTGPAAFAQSARGLAPEGWDADARLREAVDVNPDPRIVEVNITARIAEVEIAPGKTVKAWTYDGSVPGPLIRTNVGDRLIVHFTNQLDEPTTMHWHGVRVPIAMDGMPDISQPALKKGESFTYDFVVRDASLYWYHPHVDLGGPGRLRPLRPAAGRGPRRRRRRGRHDHAGAQRHRLRPARGARTGRQRRIGRHGLRPRGQLRAGQRPHPADDPRPRRRAAALAHRQRRQEPLLLPRSRRPAVHRDRPGRRAPGAAGHLRHPAHHARRAHGRDRRAAPARRDRR